MMYLRGTFDNRLGFGKILSETSINDMIVAATLSNQEVKCYYSKYCDTNRSESRRASLGPADD